MKVGEIHARLNNKQIKINGVPISKDNLQDEISVMSGYWDLDEFISPWYSKLKPSERTTIKLFNIRDFFGREPTNVKLFKFFTGFNLITLSKREEYVFMID